MNICNLKISFYHITFHFIHRTFHLISTFDWKFPWTHLIAAHFLERIWLNIFISFIEHLFHLCLDAFPMTQIWIIYQDTCTCASLIYHNWSRKGTRRNHLQIVQNAFCILIKFLNCSLIKMWAIVALNKCNNMTLLLFMMHSISCIEYILKEVTYFFAKQDIYGKGKLCN